MRLSMAVFLLLLVTTAHATTAQTTQDVEGPPPCKAICFNYRQLVILERSQAAQEGCANYISPLADPVVARVRLAPELRGSLAAAVDDLLWLTINTNKVWEKVYPSADGQEAIFRKNTLVPGCNSLALNYANTQPQDAHFMAQLGGTAFCPNEAFCQTYAEGLTFGTGVIFRVSTKGNPVVAGQVWLSRLENPNAATGCRCKDP
jgi:hypothetical protein